MIKSLQKEGMGVSFAAMTNNYRIYDFNSLLVIESRVEKIDFFEISDSSIILREVMEKREFPSLIFDFTRVVAIDSSAFGFLLETRNEIRKYGRDLAIVCQDRDVLHVMGMLKVKQVIPVFQTIDAAASYLTGIKSDS